MQGEQPFLLVAYFSLSLELCVKYKSVHYCNIQNGECSVMHGPLPEELCRMRPHDSNNSLTFQGQGVWMQAKQTTPWVKSRWAQWASIVFDKVELVWQFKMAFYDSPCIKLATYKLNL